MKHGRIRFLTVLLYVHIASLNFMCAATSESFEPCDDWDFSRHIFKGLQDLRAIFEVNERVEKVKQKAAIKNVSDQTMTFLIGRAGAGKTRLMYLLNGYKLCASYDANVGEYKMIPLPQSQSEGNVEPEMNELPQLSLLDRFRLFRMGFRIKAETWSENFFGRNGSKVECAADVGIGDLREGNKPHGYAPGTGAAKLAGTVIDLPGIQNIGSRDPGKSAEIVRDSYELKQLLEQFKRFKLMVVVPEGDLSAAGRAEGFLKIVARLNEIFPEGFDKYKDRLFFVPSHTEEIKTPAIFRNRVKKVMEGRGEVGERLLSREEEVILSYISNLPDDRIYVFPRPSQRSMVVDGSFLAPYMRANKQFLPYEGIVNICVSDSAGKYLEEKIITQPRRAVSELFRYFDQNLRFRIPPYLHEYVVEDVLAKQLRQEFNDFAHELEHLDPMHVQKVFDRIAPASGRNFRECMDTHKRCMDLMPAGDKSSFSMDGIERYKLSGTMKLLAKGPSWLDQDSETNWGAYILGTSDVQTYFSGRRRQSQFVCKSVVGVMDSNIVARGVNWLWASRLLKVGRQRRVVDLSGAHADPIPPDEEPGKKDGRDGRSGISGHSGGHFVGVFGNEDIPYPLLEFKSNGGNGGDGQKGHDGKDGADGVDEDASRGIEATPGAPGQDAGKGGKGGCGGFPGSVRLLTFSREGHETRWVQSLNHGVPGKNGDPGESGKGGKHGIELVPEGFIIKRTDSMIKNITQPFVRIPADASAVFWGVLTGPLAKKWPWQGARDALYATDKAVDEFYGVKKFPHRKPPAPSGKQLYDLNSVGWVEPVPSSKIDERAIVEAINIGQPFWKWVYVTTCYRRAE